MQRQYRWIKVHNWLFDPFFYPLVINIGSNCWQIFAFVLISFLTWRLIEKKQFTITWLHWLLLLLWCSFPSALRSLLPFHASACFPLTLAHTHSLSLTLAGIKLCNECISKWLARSCTDWHGLDHKMSEIQCNLSANNGKLHLHSNCSLFHYKIWCIVLCVMWEQLNAFFQLELFCLLEVKMVGRHRTASREEWKQSSIDNEKKKWNSKIQQEMTRETEKKQSLITQRS